MANGRDLTEDGIRTDHASRAAIKDFTRDVIRDVTTRMRAMPHRRIDPRSWWVGHTR